MPQAKTSGQTSSTTSYPVHFPVSRHRRERGLAAIMGSSILPRISFQKVERQPADSRVKDSADSRPARFR